jgi:hypothetical protein
MELRWELTCAARTKSGHSPGDFCQRKLQRPQLRDSGFRLDRLYGEAAIV